MHKPRQPQFRLRVYIKKVILIVHECAAEVLAACDSLGRVAANDDFVCEEKKGVCIFFFQFNLLPPYLLRLQGNIKIDPTTLTTKLFR